MVGVAIAAMSGFSISPAYIGAWLDASRALARAKGADVKVSLNNYSSARLGDRF